MPKSGSSWSEPAELSIGFEQRLLGDVFAVPTDPVMRAQ
jgi:hypothetical protein